MRRRITQVLVKSTLLRLAGLLGLLSEIVVPAYAHDEAPPYKEPINVMFDTDVCLDIDDGMALAIVHALQDRHEANLVAVTVSLDNIECAGYVSALNFFYGHPDIPIGSVRNGLSQRAAQEKMDKALKLHLNGQESFADFVLKQQNPDGSVVYPRRLADGSRAQDAVSLLRKTLVNQPDQRVVMIMVGNSANLAALLESQPDVISELNGRDLIKQKVLLLSVMAGAFDGTSEYRGINIYEDVTSAKKVFGKWPTPIVVSGAEIGATIRFPGISIERDFSYVSNHPIAAAYRHSCATYWKPNFTWVKTCPHDHFTADPTAVLYALRPDRNYFSVSKPGTIKVLPSGDLSFEEDRRGRHRYLIASEQQRVRAQEAMTLLVSQPPVSLIGNVR